MLSEHQCEGWLEGYLLTGRHGLFNSYEAFIRIVDSMFSQHAKWLKVMSELPWRRKIALLNYLLASHVWQQDHNGFTHQDPGFIDHARDHLAPRRETDPVVIDSDSSLGVHTSGPLGGCSDGGASPPLYPISPGEGRSASDDS
jgi:D-xylulose 5-phosphate/D-fructose 6-phosphate phosphoketolase